MPNVAPVKVTASPAATLLGVAAPLTVIGNAVVPACAVLVHDVGVVTLAAPAGPAPSEDHASAPVQTGRTMRAARSRRRRWNTSCLPCGSGSQAELVEPPWWPTGSALQSPMSRPGVDNFASMASAAASPFPYFWYSRLQRCCGRSRSSVTRWSLRRKMPLHPLDLDFHRSRVRF